MMSSSTDEPGVGGPVAASSSPLPSAKVVLYENERRWIGGGFSKTGLLPTDRSPYSTPDGSLSWRTVDEASEAMLGRGWTYEEDDVYGFERVANGGLGRGVDESLEDIHEGTTNDAVAADDDGWRYAVDFSTSALANATPKRGALHFVRRRRLVRHKRFDPDCFGLRGDVRRRCDHCDSVAVQQLSDKLLEVLSISTLLRTDAAHSLTDAVAIPLKALLIDELKIGSDLPPWLTRVDSPSRLRTLLSDLDKFPDKCSQNLLTKAAYVNMFSKSNVLQGLEDRSGEVSARYLGKEERDSIAALTIRHLDPEFNLHCDTEGCGDSCEFCPVPCPNPGCDVSISRRHLRRHDAECGFKAAECPNRCGMAPPRNGHRVHLSQACELRDATCPFRAMGCPAVVLAKDSAQHLLDGTGGHLLLIAAAMEDYQVQLKEMTGRVDRLESENAELRRLVKENDDAVRKEVGAMRKQVGKVGKEATGAHKEVGRVRGDLRKLTNETRAHVK